MSQAGRKRPSRTDNLEPPVDMRLKRRGEVAKKAERRAERERLRNIWDQPPEDDDPIID